MKKTSILAITLLPSLLLLSFVMIENNLTGMAVSDMQGIPAGMTPGEIPQYGPSDTEMECMVACTTETCNIEDMVCRRAEGTRCQAKCNVQKPEQTEEESCVETCAMQGCDEFDFECQKSHQAECDKQCGMIKEPEPKSEEEACIRACVRKVSPTLMCAGAEGGETGNEVCQRCATECVHLYAGPCLGEEKLEERKQACVTCEHCYGEPVMGDSGEGYDCIVDVVCKDASAEFGDEPGTGEGIEEQGIVSRTTERIGNVFGRVGNFFRGLFGIGEEAETEAPSESPGTESVPEETAE
ncbi:MAG: hypothetical protein V1734_03865 [Nanoarchaeota archaeon]